MLMIFLKCLKGYGNMKTNKQIYMKRYKKQYKELYPWKIKLSDIKQRCINVNNTRYKNYGGRGIKCFITAKELKELWFRDKAYKMKKPSIDRENNNGHYCFDNCRFIEMRENSSKDKGKIILQFDLEHNFLNSFISTLEAERQTGHSHKVIGRVALGKRNNAYGFIWEYKKGLNND